MTNFSAKTIPKKCKVAAKTPKTWLFAAGLALTEAFPEIVAYLHLAQSGFEEDTYRVIVRVLFVLAIVVSIAKAKIGGSDD